jgi:asparagine synthase (glutamine-hydrolysing)
MCGIVGFRSRDNFKFLREKLPEACETLAHRGPDDSGLFIDEHAGVGLAHRRLSIIDLSSAGHQPMKSDDGKVLISYNGEIYNFKEIGKLLERFGHTFNSTTDTEVVLKAYLQWGMECLEKFIGMFAFAIWDGRHQVLVLARDRLGIKPLYYHFSENHHTLLFASELKAELPKR